MKNRMFSFLLPVMFVCTLCVFGESIVYSKIDGSILRTDSDLIKYDDTYIGGKSVIDHPNWDVIDVGYGTNLSHTVMETNVSEVIENVLDENGNLAVTTTGEPMMVTGLETNVYQRIITHTNISEISDFRTKEQFLQDMKSPELKAVELELFSWLETNGLIGTNAVSLSSGTDAMVMMWLRAQAEQPNGSQLLVQYLDMKTSIEGLGGQVNRARKQ